MSDSIIYKNTCAKWLNKITGEVIYLDRGIDFNKHNRSWFLIPKDAEHATYSNNEIRSDVLLFWKYEDDKWYTMNQQSKEWFSNNKLPEFLSTGTYKGKIIWSLFK